MFKIFRKNCCGLDVHKTWIYACIGITDANSRTEYFQARFSSFSKGLQELALWLGKYNCKEVCMESAGKYWIPVFNILEKTCLLREQTERNIRKVRGTEQRKIHKKLFAALTELAKENGELTHQEQAFLKEYELTKRRREVHDGKPV